LWLLNIKNILSLFVSAFLTRIDISNNPTQAIRLKGGRVIRTLPRSVQGEMPFNVLAPKL